MNDREDLAPDQPEPEDLELDADAATQVAGGDGNTGSTTTNQGPSVQEFHITKTADVSSP